MTKKQNRGIETTTYLKIELGDSLGNKGTINDLECQWMTSGSGIALQEMPWIKTDNATSGELVNQINLCPSGALSYKKLK